MRMRLYLPCALGMPRLLSLIHISEPMLKLLKSAVANAENNNGMDVEKLYVSTAIANPGPTLKRGMPRAQGRYNRILKRTTHITLGVSEKA